MAFLFSHDELVALVVKKYPQLQHGRDFWVGHPVAPNSSTQIGEAFFAGWSPEDIPQPDIAELAKER